jgi:16S rRNA processing protein RimM
VAIGEIVAAHGLRGLLRLRAYHPPAPSLHPDQPILMDHRGTCRSTRLVGVRRGGRRVLVQLEGIGDRSAAEALIGARILVRRADLPPPVEGEFYYHELEGFLVETTAGVRLGTIASTFPTGLNDVWVVHDEEREYLVPVIADVVRAIDRARRRVVVEPLPGLFER